MKRALLLVGIVAMLGCDDNKTATATADTGPAASSAAAVATTPPPAPPPPPKKKEWKCDSTKSVDFEGDKALEGEVRLKLQKPKGAIGVGELKTIKSLNLTKYGPIDELNPCLMPKFTGIHDLFIGQGDLDDLKPIADLTTMVSLRATGNKVVDIKPLERLVHMDRLDLSHTQVTDLAPIAKMADLTELSLDDTPITDLTPLAGLTKLQKVSIQNTAIKDLSPLKGAKDLKNLNIQGTPITSYSMLQPALSKGLKVEM